LLYKTGRLIRFISLALLFGGSTACVFAAVTLVKAAVAQGIAVPQAAAANAPVFINFSRVALVAALFLLAAESIDFARAGKRDRLTLIRCLASLACVAATMIFALGIVPPMQELLALRQGSTEAAQKFHQLHEISRLVFSGTILFALISLVISALELPGRKEPQNDSS